MAHLNFKDFYQVPDLKFDVNKLRLDLDNILKKKVLNHEMELLISVLYL